MGALSGREVGYSSREFRPCLFRRKFPVWEREALPSPFALQLHLILSKVGCGGAQGISGDLFRHDIWCCTIEQCKLAIANVRFQVAAIIKRGK